MKIKQFRGIFGANWRLVLWLVPLLSIVSWLFLYRLATLVPGLSNNELHAAREAVGWQALYQHPLDLPLKLARAAVFFTFPDHGQLLTRLPNVLFGGIAVAAYAGVIRLWHGTRTAVLASLLFACSAWLLHVSRVATFDVLYLWAAPTLLLTHIALHKYGRKAFIWYISLLVWGLLLYIPGMVWPVLLIIWSRRRSIVYAWQHFGRWWQRLLSIVFSVVWLPPLIIDLLRPGQFVTWLGLPEHLATGSTLLKHFLAVPVHLFVRGPQYSELWLDKAPLLDIFTLAACALGIYYYARHWQSSRSRVLGGLFIIGLVLVGLGGPVSLSLLVPLLYFAVATGLAYLTHEWLHVFPHNPLARGLGLGLIIAAISLSCLYNARAYFVAWPNTAITRSTFHYRP